MKKICVIGSMNMDLVVDVPKFPVPGETLAGTGFNHFPGGKGGNQAVAAGRLGGDVYMLGKVGKDAYGEMYLENLRSGNIDIKHIGQAEGTPTGIALIEVDGDGENRIVIIPGTNGLVDRKYIDENENIFLKCDIFLFQLEIPLATNLYAMKKAKEAGKTVIFDPAPAVVLPDEIYGYIDYITPNETEFLILTGRDIGEEVEEMKRSACRLIEKGVRTVIAKVGKKGAYIIDKERSLHVPGYPVKTVDTTAAGDTFNAGLAYGLARGYELTECVRLANAAAAISVTGKGAQGAMPGYDKVLALM